jgi:hypothetical protein
MPKGNRQPWWQTSRYLPLALALDIPDIPRPGMPKGNRQPWWQTSRYLPLALASVGLIGLVATVLLIWWVPSALYKTVQNEPARVSAEASTRTGLLAGIAGLGALASLAIATRTYRLTQQGQITDRYTKAIEQLGSDKLDVRLGGIYALERIAVDSKRDHPTVVEVLGAFVREHSHPTYTTSWEPTVADVLAALLPGRRELAVKHQPNLDFSGDNGPQDSAPAPKPTNDVQAAVTVLGRLPKRLGVSRGNLSGALLAGASIREANLSGASLNGADLSGAHLERVDLSGAFLQRADLSGAQLNSADLSGAFLHGARLGGAHLSQTVGLTQAQLDTAYGDAATQIPNGLQRPASWPAEADSTAASP